MNRQKGRCIRESFEADGLPAICWAERIEAGVIRLAGKERKRVDERNTYHIT